MSPLNLLVCFYPTILILLPNCPFCTKAMNLLRQHGIPFNTIYNHQAPVADAEIVSRFNYRTYPKIFLNGRFIGGFSNLQTELSSGQNMYGNTWYNNLNDIGFRNIIQNVY